MTVRRLRTYLVVTLLLVVAALGATIASGDQPVLGLDLQGGISIVLAPKGKIKPGSLEVARDIIDNRVNGLGVAEPEISVQSGNIVVDLPGVKDRDKARKVVGRTAQLRFRGVLTDSSGQTFTLAPLSATTTSTSRAKGSTTTGAPASTTTTTTAPANEAVLSAIRQCDTTQVEAFEAAGVKIPNTAAAKDSPKDCVVLPSRDHKTRYFLDKSQLSGKAVSSAKSSFEQGSGYVVNIDFTSKGGDQWDTVAQANFHKPLAIELDGVVQSAPVIQPDNQAFSSFGGKAVISGSFTSDEADSLATIINYGALPVQLKALSAENVSPTLGRDQLDAGLAAGIIGLLLVALYMLVYYRLLGAIVIAGLLISASFTYALISYLGQTVGLALTLAGVTGLIVSIGVTVDSYVVYFERLKDEVRTGKTVRSSVDRGFKRSFRTIIAADLVSLIGAAALYFIAVGSVRGFAFFLGVSTVLDLLVAYFFMHPAVSLMARRPQLVAMRGIGIASGLDAQGVTA